MLKIGFHLEQLSNSQSIESLISQAVHCKLSIESTNAAILLDHTGAELNETKEEDGHLKDAHPKDRFYCEHGKRIRWTKENNICEHHLHNIVLEKYNGQVVGVEGVEAFQLQANGEYGPVEGSVARPGSFQSAYSGSPPSQSRQYPSKLFAMILLADLDATSADDDMNRADKSN